MATLIWPIHSVLTLTMLLVGPQDIFRYIKQLTVYAVRITLMSRHESHCKAGPFARTLSNQMGRCGGS